MINSRFGITDYYRFQTLPKRYYPPPQRNLENAGNSEDANGYLIGNVLGGWRAEGGPGEGGPRWSKWDPKSSWIALKPIIFHDFVIPDY